MNRVLTGLLLTWLTFSFCLFTKGQFVYDEPVVAVEPVVVWWNPFGWFGYGGYYPGYRYGDYYGRGGRYYGQHQGQRQGGGGGAHGHH